jgi:type I restriction-modification system DNA methylase subunit
LIKNLKKLREFIYANNTVENIVPLPQGSFKPYTDVKTSILYLTNVKPKHKNTYGISLLKMMDIL